MADSTPDYEVICPGLWRWARRHAEWHPGEFGAEVVSFMATAGEETLLIDPLLDGEDDPVWGLIAGTGPGPLRILITIGYHVRSTEPVRDRFAGAREVTIHAHPTFGERLDSQAGFEPFGPGDELPGGVTAHPIGKPRRQETPLHIPSQGAVVFGDAIVGTPDGEPRIWVQKKVDEKVERFYAERFAPTVEPLLDLEFDHLLLTHGPSPRGNGKAALRGALEAPPWYHRG